MAAADVIRLVNMSFYGHHGVAEAERQMGGRFSIDVEMHLDLSPAGQADDLSKTVDYKAVYELVREIEARREYSLLEALSESIAQGILERFPVEKVTVRARKTSVPIGGLMDHTEVEITRCRAK